MAQIVTPRNALVSGSNTPLTDDQLLENNEIWADLGSFTPLENNVAGTFRIDIKPLLGLMQLMRGAAIHCKRNNMPSSWAQLDGRTINCTRNAELVSLGYATNNSNGTITLLDANTCVIECGSLLPIQEQRLPAHVFLPKTPTIASQAVIITTDSPDSGTIQHQHTFPALQTGNVGGSGFAARTGSGTLQSTAAGTHTHQLDTNSVIRSHQHFAQFNSNHLNVTLQIVAPYTSNNNVLLTGDAAGLFVYIGELL